MLQICSQLDYQRGFLSVRTAALFLVYSVILQYLRRGNYQRAQAIAASSIAYRFCSILRPSVEESVLTIRSSLTRLHVLIATPSLTTLFYAKLLIVIYAAWFKSSYLIISLLVIVCILFSYSGSVNGQMVSISSIAISLSISAT